MCRRSVLCSRARSLCSLQPRPYQARPALSAPSSTIRCPPCSHRLFHCSKAASSLAASSQPASKSSPPSLSSLLPDFPRLAARIGRQQAQRELWWMIEHVTSQPLQALRSRAAASSLPLLVSSLSVSHLSSLLSLSRQRADGHPLQYLLGCTAFCSLSLLCSPPTLIPRPETEHMVEWLIHTVREARGAGWTDASCWPTEHVPMRNGRSREGQDRSELKVLDLCCGSGCVSLALAAHLHCETVGTDASTSAIALSQRNLVHVQQQLPASSSAAASRLRCSFLLDDVFASSLPSASFDLIVANPPYIPVSLASSLQPEILQHEDSSALFAGDDGLAFYPAIVTLASRLLRPRGSGSVGLPELVLEIGGDEQLQPVMDSCIKAGFADCRAYRDWGGKIRWLAARRP